MSIKFNLLLLHKEYDVHPRSWICIKGNGIGKLVLDIEIEIKSQNNINREELSKRISKKLNCSHTVIKKVLQGKRRFYPIAVILEMAILCKSKRKYLDKISERIEFLKVNSASSKPVIAIKTLTIDMAKMMGALMADGSLSYQIIIASKNREGLYEAKKTLKKLDFKISEAYSNSRKEYFISFNPNYNNFNKTEKIIKFFSGRFQIQTHMNIELTEEYKNSVEAFNKWIESCFGIKPSSFNKRENAWRSIFSNKILGRYLICFFGMKSGYKTDIASEPEIIKKSSNHIRKAFALGVLTFDGSSSISGNITFTTKSKKLFDSIGNILRNNKINFGTKYDRETYTIFTYKNNNSHKLNELFEENTVKWMRFKESYKKIERNNFEVRYKKFSQSKVTFDKLIQILDKVKVCDIIFLAKYFGCSHTNIVHYLNILKNNGRIRMSNRPKRFNKEFVSPKTTVFLKNKFHNEIFDKIRNKFAEYKKFGLYLEVERGTLSAWKVKKNRIPLHIVKRFCEVLDIDSSEIDKNIEEADRRIIEII